MLAIGFVTGVLLIGMALGMSLQRHITKRENQRFMTMPPPPPPYGETPFDAPPPPGYTYH